MACSIAARSTARGKEPRQTWWMPLGTLTACLLAATVAWGQGTGGRNASREMFPTVNRQLEQLLTKAEGAVGSKEYAEAIRLLGPLLAGDIAQLRRLGAEIETDDVEADAFLDRRRGAAGRVSFKAEVLRLFGSLPHTEMKYYEAEYGQAAESLLKTGLKDANPAALREASRRYFFTKAGLQATAALGRYQLEQGHPRSAAATLQRLADSPLASALAEPATFILLAGAWWQAGEEERAIKALETLKSFHPALLQPGNKGGWVDPAQRPEAVAWLRSVFGSPTAGKEYEARHWLTYRGGPERNTSADFSAPLSLPRWRVPLLNNAEQDSVVTQQARLFRQQELPWLPVIQPVSVQNTVLFRDPEKLIAVDVATGKRIWEYHWLVPRTNLPLATTDSLSENELRQRIWLNSTYGQLSSDGEFVWLVEAAAVTLPGISLDSRMARALPQCNRLVCLNLAKQGAVEWSTGGFSGEREPNLRAPFFLGPPLVVNGRLMILGEQRSALYLFVLDQRSGRLLWKQQLLASEAWQSFAIGRRHLFGAVPSFADGMLVCPTGAGFVIGIDLATQSLAWTTPYQSSDQPAGFSLQRRSLSVPYCDSWMENTATIVDGKALVTSTDSQQLLCLDLRSGKLLWSASRQDSLFVAAVRNGNACLVGKKTIRSCQLSDGSPLWPNVAVGLAAGRGVATETHFYQPTQDRRLVSVDLTSGAIEDSWSLNFMPGNLIPLEDTVISVSHEDVTACFRVGPLEQRIAKTLAKNAGDPWALARQAELLLHREEYAQAWEVLKPALADRSHDPAVPTLLVTAGLALLDRDFNRHEGRLEDIVPLLAGTRLEQEYYRVVCHGREKAGQFAEAFRLLLQMERDDPAIHVESYSRDYPFIERDRHLRMRLDCWINTTAARLWWAAPPDQRKEMDQLVREERQRVHVDSLVTMRRFVERFPFHPLADSVRLMLAGRLFDLGNLLEAELALEPLLTSSQLDTAGQAWAQRINILAAAERWSEVVPACERLQRDFATRNVSGNRTGEKFAAQMEKQVSYRLAREKRLPEFPRGRVELVEQKLDASERVDTLQPQPWLCSVVQPDPHRPSRLTVILNASNNKYSLLVRDDAGRELQSVALRRPRVATPSGTLTARFLGHLLLVSTGAEVVALDILRFQHDSEQAILWQQELNGVPESDMRRTAAPRATVIENPLGVSRFVTVDSQNQALGGVGHLTEGGVCLLSQRMLTCVSPLSGETLWQRNDLTIGSEISGDAEFVFVSSPKGNQVRVFRLADGSEIEEAKIAAPERRLFRAGDRVLWWDQARNPGAEDAKTSKAPIDIRLTRITSGEDLWRETLPAGSRATLVGSDEFAIFQPDGRLVIRSLLGSTLRLEAKLEKEDELQRLHMLRSETQYLVFVGVKERDPIREWKVSPAPRERSNEGENLPYAIKFTGKVYAFDRQTGKPQWPAPAAISEMGLPFDQPLEQPVLVFHRNLESSRGGFARESASSLLCLDKRSGAQLYFEDHLGGSIYEYSIDFDAEQRSVRVRVPQRTLTFRFTSDPAPPEPPLQFDQAFVVRKGLVGALFRLLGPAIRNASDDAPPMNADDPFE